MITDEKKKLLALHRLREAKESLEEARYLFEGGKTPRSVANADFGAFDSITSRFFHTS